MKYSEGTRVYAASGGLVVRRFFHSAVGNVVILLEWDSPEQDETQTVRVYQTYEHLQEVLVNVNDEIVPGELIALSGNTGSASSGAHLHFQRATVEPTFSSLDIPHALRMPPIDGEPRLVDDDVPSENQGPFYLSTNAGVGYNSNRVMDQGFKFLYNNDGGYGKYGRPAAVFVRWMPCWWQLEVQSTHWRYACSSGAYSGTVQTFRAPEPDRWIRLYVRATGSTDVWPVAEQIAYALTSTHTDGKDFVHHIGYPLFDVKKWWTTWNPSVMWYQSFQNGEIRFFDRDQNSGVCRLEVHIGSIPTRDLGPRPADWEYESTTYCGENLQLFTDGVNPV